MQPNRQRILTSGLRLSIILGIFLAISFSTQFAILKALSAFAFLGVLAFVLYRYWVSKVEKDLALPASILSICAYLSMTGTILFYASNLSAPMIWTLGAIAALAPFILEKASTTHILTFEMPNLHLSTVLLGSISATTALATLCIIGARATIASSQSPWIHLPVSVYILFGIALLTAILLALREQGKLPLLNFYLLLVTALGVATILYPLGYGFDPAIHQATEQLLLSTGTITPTPLFYMGHYALVTILATYSGIAIPILDAYLSLLLTVLLLPPLLRAFAQNQPTLNKKNIVPLFFFIVPYTYLIQSTPQSISFLLSLITILLLTIYHHTRAIPLTLIALPALTALFFHPLTGLPITAAVLLYALYYHERLPRVLRRLALIVASVGFIAAVPLSLIIAGLFSNEFSISYHFTLPSFAALMHTAISQRIVRFDDIVYSVYSLVWIFISISAAIGIAISIRRLEGRNALLLPYCALLSALSALCIAIFFSFNFRDGEQNIFSVRLIVLAGLFLYPATSAGISWILERLWRKGAFITMLTGILLSSGMVTTWYMSYPRFDTRAQSKGYSPSQADYAAVHWIEADAQGAPHIVLANQVVSAVAVKEFGFGVTNGTIASYPLPTNGYLYPYFLESMDIKKNITDSLAPLYREKNVERIYVVLNEYWTQAETLRAMHQARANRSITLDDGSSVDIFIYQAP